MPSQRVLAVYRGSEIRSVASPLFMSVSLVADSATSTDNVRGEKVTLIALFGVEDGIGNATVTSSDVCVHEYGGGFAGVVGSAVVTESKFSPARGMGAISSGLGL